MGNKKWLYKRKAEVEEKFGKWYEEPQYDPWSDEFDPRAHRQIVQDILQEFSGTPFGGKSIAWKNVTAVVPVADHAGYETVGTKLKGPVNNAIKRLTCAGFGKQEKAILDNISGYADSGSMVLIQAPPGAGTTTMLNCLSGVTQLYKTVNGEVLYNGDNIWERETGRLYAHAISRVRQEDEHYAQLTVRETLSFAASCGFPDFVPFSRIIQQHRVETVASFLGIAHTMDTKVGNESLRGVSGGEKKRVTIAEIICGSPSSFLFLDNISKGLDAATTLDICKGIHRFAKVTDSVVFCSLQQIGNEAFELFDQVCLLDAGKCFYYGPREQVEPFFRSIGFQRPQQRSIGDFLLSVTDKKISKTVIKPGYEGNAPKTIEEFVHKYESSLTFKNIQRRLDEGVIGSAPRMNEISDEVKSVYSQECLQSLSRQLILLTKRATRLSWDRSTVVVQFLSQFLIALIIGSLFFRLPLTSSGAYSRGSVLFMVCTTYAIGAVRSVGAKFNEMRIFLKQRQACFYRAAPFHLAGVLDALILTIPVSLLYSTVVYFMVGLNISDAGLHFAFFFFTAVTLALNMELVARTVTVLSPNADVAIVVVNIIVVSCIIFSGYLIPLESCPPWFVWIFWISPVQYAFRAFVYNEFNGLNFTCEDESELLPEDPAIPVDNRVCPVSSGSNYIESRFGFDPDTKWDLYSVAIIWSMNLLLFFVITISARRQRYRGTPYIEKLEEEEGLDEVDVEVDENIGIQKAYFTWAHVDYSVPTGNGYVKTLLQGVSGYAKPGTLCALMGSSGAGKTTLMDVLARRKTKGTIEGDVRVNGLPQDRQFGRMSGYVEQMDIHVTRATVREAIEFSARLRLPQEVSEEQKQKTVESTLNLLELRDVQHNIIGQLGDKIALSGEERKRLTIAVELAAKPSILFLDEPTSGLDSRAALKVVRALRRVADTGCAVVCTIHQPSREVFSSFDYLLLLQRGGLTAYFGELGAEAKTMVSYFEKNGSPVIDPERNPADYMLDQIGAGVTYQAERDWHHIWRRSPECKALLEQVEVKGEERPAVVPEDAQPIHFDGVFATSSLYQFRINMLRTMRTFWRNPEHNVTRTFNAIIQALILGFAFFQIDQNQSGAQIIVGAVFMGGLYSLVSISTSVTPVIGDRIAFYRETAARIYTPAAYYLTLGIADLPFNVLSTSVFTIIFYFLVGFRASSFGFFFVSSLLYSQWAVSTGSMFGALAPSMTIALICVPVMNIVLNNMSGFLIPKNLIPAWYIWIYWINPSAYFLSGNLKNLLTGLEFRCDPGELAGFEFPTDPNYPYANCSMIPPVGTYSDAGSGICSFCPVTSGDQILASLDVPMYNKWISVGALLCFYLFSRFIGLLGFRFLRFLKR